MPGPAGEAVALVLELSALVERMADRLDHLEGAAHGQ